MMRKYRNFFGWFHLELFDSRMTENHLKGAEPVISAVHCTDSEHIGAPTGSLSVEYFHPHIKLFFAGIVYTLHNVPFWQDWLLTKPARPTYLKPLPVQQRTLMSSGRFPSNLGQEAHFESANSFTCRPEKQETQRPVFKTPTSLENYNVLLIYYLPEYNT